MARSSRSGRAALLALALGLATAAVYAPAASFGFVSYDDPEYVSRNPSVQRGVSLASLEWAFTSVHHGNWHPLTTLSWMLECGIFGVDPQIQHRVNIFLHAANTVLLFLLLLRATGALWPSALVAALFGLHPLHVESVAWISSRKDVLSTACALASTHAYVTWVRSRRPAAYAATLLLFGLGLMAKPMLVTWPFVLLLFDVWPLRRFELGARGFRSRRRAAEDARERARLVRVVLLEKAPMLALTGGSIALTIWAQRTGGALKETPLYPLGERIANALQSYVAYLWRSVWPQGLAVLYPFPPHIATLPTLGSALLVAAVTLACFRLRHGRPYLGVGWLWYLGTLVPVIGIVQVGVQASADRYTYLPSIGLSIAIVWGIGSVAERARRLRPALGAAACAVLVLLAGLTVRQVRFWQDSIHLYRHGLRVTRHNAVLSNNLGIALGDAGRHAEAIDVYEQGLSFPSPVVHILHYNLGIALARAGRHADALAHFDRTLRRVPDHDEARFHRAKSLEALGRLDEARRDLERVVERVPGEADPQLELGLVLGKQGDLDGARRHLSRAIALDPERMDARINLAVADWKSGEPAAAVRELEEVLRRDPDNAAARRYLEQVRAGE